MVLLRAYLTTPGVITWLSQLSTSTIRLIIRSLVLHNLSRWRSKLAIVLASTARGEVFALVYDAVAKGHSSLQRSFLSLYSLASSVCALTDSKRSDHACGSNDRAWSWTPVFVKFYWIKFNRFFVIYPVYGKTTFDFCTVLRYHAYGIEDIENNAITWFILFIRCEPHLTLMLWQWRLQWQWKIIHCRDLNQVSIKPNTCESHRIQINVIRYMYTYLHSTRSEKPWLMFPNTCNMILKGWEQTSRTLLFKSNEIFFAVAKYGVYF